MKRVLQILIPLAILAVAIMGAGAMIAGRPPIETMTPETPVPVVRVMRAAVEDVNLTIHSQGTVQPRTMISLVAQVAGRIKTFKIVQGDAVYAEAVLVEIDATLLQHDADAMTAQRDAAQATLDLLVAGSRPEEIDRATALVAQAKAMLDEAQAGSRPQQIKAAEATVELWRADYAQTKSEFERNKDLREEGTITASEFDRIALAYRIAEARLHEAEHNLALVMEGSRKEAIAQLRAAYDGALADLALARSGARAESIREQQARVAQMDALVLAAKRRVKDAVISAPFDGLLRDKLVDEGQYVTPGTALGTLIAVDAAEIRLPLSEDQLAFVDVPFPSFNRAGSGDGPDTRPFPPVTLSARVRGELHSWQGRIVRTDGEFDPRTRLMDVVARVEKPYEIAGEDGEVLAVGLWVEAEIQGLPARNVVRLPRAAMRDSNHVLIVDDEAKLRFRQVHVLRSEGEQVVIDAGLKAGERVCLSNLLTVTDGMQVRVAGEHGDADATLPPSGETAP